MMDTIVDTREDARVLRRDVSMLRLEFDGAMRKLSVLQNNDERLTRKVDTLQRGVDAILTHLGLAVEPDDRDS